MFQEEYWQVGEFIQPEILAYMPAVAINNKPVTNLNLRT